MKALGADCVVTDKAEGQRGGCADDGGRQLKASEPETQRGVIRENDPLRKLHIHYALIEHLLDAQC
jgi:hypothetical protein